MMLKIILIKHKNNFIASYYNKIYFVIITKIIEYFIK